MSDVVISCNVLNILSLGSSSVFLISYTIPSIKKKMFKILIASLYVMFTQMVTGLQLEPNRYAKLQSCITNTIASVFDEDDSLLFITDKSGGFVFPETITNPQDLHERTKYSSAFSKQIRCAKGSSSIYTIYEMASKNTFLFITNYGDSRRVVTETYKWMCLSNFYNIFIIAYNKDFNPTLVYVDQFAMANHCGEKLQHYTIGYCNNSTKTHGFPKTFRKYPNCKLTVKQPNLLSKNQLRNLAITARGILDVVSDRLNTSLQYSYDMVQDSSFDIYIRHVSHHILMESSSVPFFYNDIVWIVPTSKQIPPLVVLKIIFKPLMWVFVILAVILTSLVWWFFVKIFKRGAYTLWCDVFFDVYSITVLGYIRRVPRHLAFRFIFISYVIYAIHIQIAFNSNLVRILTIPQYEPHIKNLEELDASNLSIFIVDTVRKWLIHTDLSIDLHKRIFDKMKPLPAREYSLMVKGMDAANYSMFSFHDDYSYTKFKMNQTTLDHFVDNSFSGSLNYVFYGNSSVNIQPAFNLVVTYLIETGVVDHFNKMYNMYCSYFLKNRNPENVVITMEHICSVFVIWGLGLVLSFAIFLIEILTTIVPAHHLERYQAIKII
ncbi:hypothetical protein FQR65_LT14705 [Abscondita terminalis]|nr:hypothetical protein FQR65_LT14705 [Abscondita terminalis]